MPWSIGPVRLLAALLLAIAVRAAEPAWQPWDDGVFARAQREHRLVLLDLGAVWCHWCHVMEETTYRDPAVTALLREQFIAVQVDQDARPDLANRYEDYGWPATVIFDATGRELVKLRGYIPPPRMASLLQAVIDDPTPGPSAIGDGERIAPAAGGVTPVLRDELHVIFRDGYDAANGGWGTGYKFIDADTIEYALVRGAQGEEAFTAMARTTLDAARALIDPVWGGCYQYSTGGVWNEPHFEKIMPIQAEALRAYALAYARWQRPQDRETAQLLVRYLRDFLTDPEGAFYTSQDADLHPGEHAGDYFKLDDAGRRAQGIPRIDRHRYARDNGLMIASLCAWHAASGEPEPLETALRAAQWVVANRAAADGGFRHGETDAAGPYLSDTLAMGRAFLALSGVTGDRDWLERAKACARVIATRFAAADGAGYVTAITAAGSLPSAPQRDENLALARFANLLAAATADEGHRALAQRALAFLAAPAIARRRPVAGLLLLDRELAGPPLHIQVQAADRAQPDARALFAAALAEASSYKLVEWVDRPASARPSPVALVCGATSCSPPLATPADLRRYLQRQR